MIIRQDETNNLNTITVPKTAISYGVAPLIYVNNQMAPNQGFWQDAKNYYIWYKTTFNSYELLIVFEPKASLVGFPIAATLSISLIAPLSIAAVLLKERKESPRKNMRIPKLLFRIRKILNRIQSYFYSTT